MKHNSEKRNEEAAQADASLEQKLADFLEIYAPRFTSLAEALDGARISHYSHACGPQHVTFDIFPASAYVHGMLSMLSLNRTHRAKPSMGFKDTCLRTNYNPAQEFVQFMRRWHGFAEQVMRIEGDSLRGIAAARAKLIMDDLLVSLTATAAADLPGTLLRGAQRTNAFARLMHEISLALDASQKVSIAAHKRNVTDLNYVKALAKARFSMVVPKITAHLHAKSA